MRAPLGAKADAQKSRSRTNQSGKTIIVAKSSTAALFVVIVGFFIADEFGAYITTLYGLVSIQGTSSLLLMPRPPVTVRGTLL